MSKAPELHAFIEALKRDPQAEAPPGLDPALADLMRALVLDDLHAAPSPETLGRIWQRALTDARRASSSAHRPKFSVNGRNTPPRKPGNREYASAGPRARSIGLPARAVMPLAAAVASALLFVMLLLPAIFNHSTPRGPDSVWLRPDERNERVFRRYIDEVWNAGRFETLDDLLTADCVRHTPGLPDITGADGIASVVGAFRAVYPDPLLSLDSLSAGDERVEAWVRVTVTVGDSIVLPDGIVLAPTNDQITYDLQIEARFVEDGDTARIAEIWTQPDGVGLWLQMAALTDDETPAAVKDEHIGAAFRLDQVLDEAEPTAANLTSLVDPALSVHEQTRDGVAVERPYADLVAAGWNQDSDAIRVERTISKGDLVAVQLLVREETSGAPHWAEQITLYRFEQGRIAELWRFWNRDFEEENTP
jgi:predicted SnoaL-like aldol condensation-catalyzing enzyme